MESAVMTSTEEFAFIAAQLGWLHDHLRSQVQVAQSVRMECALSALDCARAVIIELAHLGGDAAEPTAAAVVMSAA